MFDVSEHHPAETALRQTEERYRMLVDQAADVIFTVDAGGVLSSLNEAFERITGWDRHQWLGKPLGSLVHPDHLDAAADMVAHALGGGVLPARDLRVVGADGLDVAVEVTASPLFEEGRVVGVLGIARDVTQRRQIREARLEEHERYRALVEASPDAIAAHVRGVITFANPAMARLVGAEHPRDLMGRSILEFVHTGSRPAVLDRLRRLREGGAVRPLTERFRRLDGTTIDVDVATTTFVQDGEPAVQLVARHADDRLRAEEALRDSEERYRRLVEMSPDAIAVHQGGRFVFANAAMARLVGSDHPHQLIGTPILDVVHPDYRAIVEQRARQQTEEGRAVPLLEERIIRRDGRIIDVDVAGIPISFKGKPAGQIVVRDITDRKRAELALTKRNEYLAALHETSLALMHRLDVGETLENIAARAAALLGTGHGYIYLVDEASQEMVVRVGIGAFAAWTGYRLAAGQGMAGTVWATGQPLVVNDYDAWEGRAFPLGVFRAVVGVPLTSGRDVVGVLGLAYVDGDETFGDEEVELLAQFAGLASVALDNARLNAEARRELAERRRSEDQFRAAEEKYRTLVEQLPATIYVDEFDPGLPIGYRTVYVSPQVQGMLGYSPEEILADPDLWPSLIHPEDRERALAEDARHYSSGEPLTHEYRVVARDGRVRWLLDEAVGLLDESGRLRYSQGVLYDITDRMRVQEDLERALGVEREAGERLRALDELKTTFLHAVSHELRTPLSSVLGLALTLERQEVQLPEAERVDLVHRLAANARKLDQLLSDLLDLDRLDRGIVEPRRRPTDVATLVRRVVENSDVLGTRPVRVDAELVVAAVDGPKVERIVENLVANAARYTPPHSTIWVRVRPQDGGVLLVVEDEGDGVPESLRETIFEPFRQGPNAPAHSPGVGIGLSLVARFAQLHGGRAWVEDRPGGGAAFKVLLPGRAG